MEGCGAVWKREKSNSRVVLLAWRLSYKRRMLADRNRDFQLTKVPPRKQKRMMEEWWEKRAQGENALDQCLTEACKALKSQLLVKVFSHVLVSIYFLKEVLEASLLLDSESPPHLLSQASATRGFLLHHLWLQSAEIHQRDKRDEE